MLIVGAGLAGLRAAIAAADAGADVALITKVHPVRSHTCCAQGGINGALGDDDSWEAHMFDTVKGADYLGDQDAIEIMTREAPHDLIELEHMGCPSAATTTARSPSDRSAAPATRGPPTRPTSRASSSCTRSTSSVSSAASRSTKSGSWRTLP